MLTYETWEEDSMSFSERDETKGALAVLEWAYKQYNDEIVYACKLWGRRDGSFTSYQ